MAYKHIVHEIPYLDTRDINLDWLIRNQRYLNDRINEIEHEVAPETVVIPEQYGAVGDGIADDTTAIQQCIDENPLATIIFKKGIYRITDTIYLYNEWGGQYVIFGGARIVWDGGMNTTRPMISVTKETEHDPKYSSAARVIGGNFDGRHRCGYCIEFDSYYGTLDASKCFGFTNAGVFIGNLAKTAANQKSMQAHVCNLMIYQNEGDYSLEDTRALIAAAPDSEYSQIVTNRTRIAFSLWQGGNSFVNCHSTIQFANSDIDDAAYERTMHIELDPPSSGSTQQNTFNGCYFNMGKYVVFARIASRLTTNLESCFYVWFTTNNYKNILTRHAVLCGGKPSDFRCSNIDILVGMNNDPDDPLPFSVLDYFPESAPSLIPLPDMIRVNSNDRHSDAPVYSAWNLQPEDTLTPVVSASTPATAGVYYEIGAVMLCYGGAETTRVGTTPFIVKAYNSQIAASWTIAFDTDMQPVIIDRDITSSFEDLQLYIAESPEMITLEGITYPTYKIYLRKANYSTIREFVYMENNSPFVKCYMRNTIDAGFTVPDGTGLLRLDPSPTDSRHFLLTGDSYGVEHLIVGALDFDDYGWTLRLKEKLQGMGHSAINFSAAGAGFIDRGGNMTFGQIMADHCHPYITDVVICGGTNDREQDPADLRTAILDCIDTIHGISPNARVWIGMDGHNTNPTVQATLDSVSYPVYRDAAMEGTNSLYLFNCQTVLEDSDMASDGTHPTPDGNIKLGRYLAEMLFGQTNAGANAGSIGASLWEPGTGTESIVMPSEGDPNAASGNSSIALGNGNSASGVAATAEGYHTIASGTHSHAEGSATQSTMDDAHAEGNNTQATAPTSHSEGRFTIAKGLSSHAQGYGTVASRLAQHVAGMYNIEDTQGANPYVEGEFIEIIGNGTMDNARSNARTLDWSGNETLAGDLTAKGGRINDYTGGTIIGSGSKSVSFTGDGALMLFCRGSDVILYAVDYWTANAATIFSNGSNLPTITKAASSRDITINNPNVQSFAWMIIGSYLK